MCSQNFLVRAFHVLAQMPVLPLRPQDKIDIVPANYVGKAIVTIHQKEAPAHGIYHLSSGTGSQTYQELTDAISQAGGMLRPMRSEERRVGKECRSRWSPYH